MHSCIIRRSWLGAELELSSCYMSATLETYIVNVTLVICGTQLGGIGSRQIRSPSLFRPYYLQKIMHVRPAPPWR
jgi:hypothetical protein